MFVRKSVIFFIIVSCFSLSAAHAAEKPRIAIMTPSISEGVSNSVKRYLHLDMIVSQLEKSIQSSRKFAVITRDKSNMTALLTEQAFSQSAASSGNAAKSGMMDATNYLVMPLIKDFVFYRKSTPVPNIDSKYSRKDSGRLKVEIQIQSTTTGEIKAIFDLVSSFAIKAKVVNKKGGAPNPIHYETMVKKIAASAADQIIDTVFPMKVISVDGQSIFINRGKDGGLKKGDKLILFSPGAAMIDPDTGENLGSAEREVGEIVVSRINPKFTIAKISNLDAEEFVEIGYIVRRPY